MTVTQVFVSQQISVASDVIFSSTLCNKKPRCR